MIARSLDVVVVGAANVDLVVQVPRLPLAGETVFGAPLTVLPGGKGLNQAVAVARNGGNVALVSRIGTDGWGDLLHEALVGAGVGIAAVARQPGSATGAAIVLMPPDGDSALVLSRAPGGLPTTA